MFTRSTPIKVRKSRSPWIKEPGPLWKARLLYLFKKKLRHDCVSSYVTVSGQTLPDLISEFSFHVFFFFSGPFYLFFSPLLWRTEAPLNRNSIISLQTGRIKDQILCRLMLIQIESELFFLLWSRNSPSRLLWTVLPD